MNITKSCELCVSLTTLLLTFKLWMSIKKFLGTGGQYEHLKWKNDKIFSLISGHVP